MFTVSLSVYIDACWCPVSKHVWDTPEHFKTRVAHFPMQRDERTGIQRATVGKSGCEAAS